MLVDAAGQQGESESETDSVTATEAEGVDGWGRVLGRAQNTRRGRQKWREEEGQRGTEGERERREGGS